MTNNATQITASMLYDLIQCPHRVFLDRFGDKSGRDSTSPFVELLWERGTAYEREVIEGLNIPFTNVRAAPVEDREHLTIEAMTRGEALIYGGRVASGDLLGEPDLLRRSGRGYVAGDIKSGSGEEGRTDVEGGKPKAHYAVQLALYTEILEREGVSAGRTPFVWDIRGREVPYALEARPGPRTPNTLWQSYEETRENARAIIERTLVTRAALSSTCKLCHWRTTCFRELKGDDDLTLIPELGRSARKLLIPRITTVNALASAELPTLIHGERTVFPGLGAERLRRYHARATLQLVSGSEPYLLHAVAFPSSPRELFFDIETDPMREICYLHGFLIREGGRTDIETYLPFFADSPTQEAEEAAFTQAVSFVRSQLPCAMYFYSKYERTWWRTLQERYPSVAGAEEIERWFETPMGIDLYGDVVKPQTIWPTHDHSIKTLAAFLGFEWRDTDPSGASSIEWYDNWVGSGNPEVKQRILDYNEDDCRATRVLLDGLRRLEVREE
jgi:uncharacterized protein